jgi:hypothetical protein
MTRTVPSDRDVRTRSTGFHVDLGTRYVTICLVSLFAGSQIVMSELVRLVFALTFEHVIYVYVQCRLLQEGVGKALYHEAHGARIVGGGIGKQ